MRILHILYVFQSLTIPFLSAHLKKLQIILNTFIWWDKRPRIKSATLLRPTKLTGLGVPNIALYYKATILNQLRPCWQPDDSLALIQIKRRALVRDPKTCLGAVILHPQSYKSYLDTITAAFMVWTPTMDHSHRLSITLQKIALNAFFASHIHPRMGSYGNLHNWTSLQPKSALLISGTMFILPHLSFLILPISANTPRPKTYPN